MGKGKSWGKGAEPGAQWKGKGKGMWGSQGQEKGKGKGGWYGDLKGWAKGYGKQAKGKGQGKRDMSMLDGGPVFTTMMDADPD